jgi:outer membrane protein assembly factor BamA
LRPAALFALALAALPLLPAAGAAEAPATPKPPPPFAAEGELSGKPIAEVVIEGLVTVKPEEVRKAMATRPGLAFHPATYREDFRRIYDLGFFENVILERPELIAAGVRVVVRLRERPIIDALELRGNRRVRTNSLIEAARGEKDKTKEGWKPTPILAVGGRYDQYLAYQMERAFRELYTEKRFPLARIEPRAEPVPGRPGHVVAVFEIVEDRPVIISQVILQDREGKPLAPALPAKKLLNDVVSRPGCWLLPARGYDPDALRLDALRIQEIYRNNGYSDARVTAPEPRIAEPAGLRKRRRAVIIFEIHEGRMYRYGPVSFENVTLVSDEEVARRAGLRPGKPPSEDQLRRAARELKLLREAELRMCVERGPAYFDKPLWFESMRTDLGREGRNGIQLGKPYSEEAVHQAAKRIEALLGEYGRPFARAEARRQETAEPGVTAIRFVVNEGPEATVGEVRIKGNVKTQDRVIRRQMEIFPGDIYDSRKVADSQANLRRRGLFEKVGIRPEHGEEPDVVDLEVEVKEQLTGLFNIGAYANPDDGSVGGIAALSYRNFDWRNPPRSWDDLPGFGGGDQTLTLRATFSEKSQSFSIEHLNPWIWDTPEHYSLRTTLFHTVTEYKDFDAERDGASITLGRRLVHRWLRGYLKYTIKNVYVSNVDDEAPDILRDQEGYTIFSSGKAGLIFDTLDHDYLPTKGVLLEASEEVFGSVFGGDQDLRKTELEGNGFLPLFRTWGYPHLLHLRALADWVNPYGRNETVPPSERFYAGGISTVRGFESRTITPRIDDYSVGGDFMMVESVEYIFPLFQDTLRGVLFFDAGNVWEKEGDFELHDQRRSVGTGILIQVPALGQQPIKLYFSKALNPHKDEDTQVFQMSFSVMF